MTDENQENRKKRILKLTERVRKMMGAAVLLSTAPLTGHKVKESEQKIYNFENRKDYFVRNDKPDSEAVMPTAEIISNPLADKYEANFGEYKIISFLKDQTEETKTTEE